MVRIGLHFIRKGGSDVVHRTGEIVYVEVLGRPMVYLNSMEAVKTLFDKRSALYADRPISYMLTL